MGYSLVWSGMLILWTVQFFSPFLSTRLFYHAETLNPPVFITIPRCLFSYILRRRAIKSWRKKSCSPLNAKATYFQKACYAVTAVVTSELGPSQAEPHTLSRQLGKQLNQKKEMYAIPPHWEEENNASINALNPPLRSNKRFRFKQEVKSMSI